MCSITNVQYCKCVVLQMCSITNVQYCKCVVLQMCSIANVQYYKCVVLQMCSVTNVQYCKCVVLQMCSVTNVQCYNCVVLQMCSITNVQYCKCVVLQMCSVTNVQCYNCVVLQMCSVTNEWGKFRVNLHGLEVFKCFRLQMAQIQLHIFVFFQVMFQAEIISKKTYKLTIPSQALRGILRAVSSFLFLPFYTFSFPYRIISMFLIKKSAQDNLIFRYPSIRLNGKPTSGVTHLLTYLLTYLLVI